MRILLTLAIIIAVPASAVELDYLEVVDLDNQLIEHDYFNLSYNSTTNQPNWVSYRLTPDMIKDKSKVDDKYDNFHIDKSVIGGTPTREAYEDTDFEHGHMVTDSHMRFDKYAFYDTYLMSNICPQYGGFNRGIWKDIEERVKEWAEEYGEVYVICGPIIQAKKPEPIKEETGIAIPDKFFKVVLTTNPRKSNTCYQAIGFVLDHNDDKTTKKPKDLVKNIKYVEEKAGYDFFSALPDDIEKRIEEEMNPEDWVW